MDIFEFRANFRCDMESVFCVKKLDDIENTLELMFLELERDLMKEIKTTWDIISLEKYLAEKNIPGGLRWQLPLSSDNESDLAEWELLMNQRSSNVIKFIIAKRKKKLKQLNEKIDILQEKLKPFIKSEKYKELSKKCQKSILKADEEVKNKKLRKYLKVTEDYKKNKVYKWKEKLSEAESRSNENQKRSDIASPTQGDHIVGNFIRHQNGYRQRGHPNHYIGEENNVFYNDGHFEHRNGNYNRNNMRYQEQYQPQIGVRCRGYYQNNYDNRYPTNRQHHQYMREDNKRRMYQRENPYFFQKNVYETEQENSQKHQIALKDNSKKQEQQNFPHQEIKGVQREKILTQKDQVEKDRRQGTPQKRNTDEESEDKENMGPKNNWDI